METLLLVTIWTLVAGWIGYAIGFARRAAEVKQLRQDRYYLRKWQDQQNKAELERSLDEIFPYRRRDV